MMMSEKGEEISIKQEKRERERGIYFMYISISIVEIMKSFFIFLVPLQQHHSISYKGLTHYYY